jgi:hypothetical protein
LGFFKFGLLSGAVGLLSGAVVKTSLTLLLGLFSGGLFRLALLDAIYCIEHLIY